MLDFASLPARVSLSAYKARAHVDVDKYVNETLTVFGFTAMGLAIGCVKLGSIGVWVAWVAAYVLAFTWWERCRPFIGNVRALRTLKDDYAARRILRSICIALVGWMLLGSVAVGLAAPLIK